MGTSRSHVKAKSGEGNSRRLTTALPAELATSALNTKLVFLPTIFFLAPLATSIAPRLTPFAVAVVSLSLVGSALRGGMQWRELLPRQVALAAWLIFAAYVLLNATWAADPTAGVGKAALLIALILMSFAAVTASAHLDPAILRRAALAFVAGATVGALYVMLELLTRGIIIRTAVGWFPNLSSPKHFKISHGLLAIRPSKLDDNVNLAIFHLWPGLLALVGLAGTRRVSIQVLFFLTIAATVALSEHNSSQVALLGSGLVVLLAWKWRAIVIRTLAFLWCAAFVLVLPANFAAFESGLHHSAWLPKPARARVILWEFTSEQVLQRPWLGVGVDFYATT